MDRDIQHNTTTYLCSCLYFDVDEHHSHLEERGSIPADRSTGTLVLLSYQGGKDSEVRLSSRR